jgi:hypothetical protein
MAEFHHQWHSFFVFLAASVGKFICQEYVHGDSTHQ